MRALQRIVTGCSLRSVSAIGPRRAGAAAGRLPLPILHRGPAARAARGPVFSRELASCRRDRLARPAGRTRVPAVRRLRPARPRRRYRRLALPTTRATPGEKVLWPTAGGLGKCGDAELASADAVGSPRISLMSECSGHVMATRWCSSQAWTRPVTCLGPWMLTGARIDPSSPGRPRSEPARGYALVRLNCIH